MPATTQPAPAPSRGVYLLTNPRSASNLFQKMLADQPGMRSSGYYFMNAALSGVGKVTQAELSSRPEDEQRAIFAPYNEAFASMQAELNKAHEENQRVLLKEHACFLFSPDTLTYQFRGEKYPRFVVDSKAKDDAAPATNPTCLPDEVLLSMRPIFQIRHPVRMFPSMLRALRFTSMPYTLKAQPTMNMRYTKLLYDWYTLRADAAPPLIIDADDIMGNKAAVRQLCIKSGLDPDMIKYEWATTDEQDPLKKRFLSTLNGSTGIIPGLDSKGLVLEDEAAKWREEFGEEEGSQLVELARAAMPYYEFLHARRETGAEAATTQES